MDPAELIALEHEMWRADTRGDRVWMDRHLADDFRELGRSGRLHSRDETLDAPVRRFAATLSPIAVEPVTDDVALLTYRSTVAVPPTGEPGDPDAADDDDHDHDHDHDDDHDAISEHANRSSLWVHRDGRWQLRFHQGTPIAIAEA